MDCFSALSMRFWVGQDELDIDCSHFRVHFWVKMRWKQRSRFSVMMDDIFILDWLVVWNMDFIFPYIGNHGPN